METEYVLAFSRAICTGKGDNSFALYMSLMLVETGTSQDFSHSILINVITVFIFPNVRKQNSLE